MFFYVVVVDKDSRESTLPLDINWTIELTLYHYRATSPHPSPHRPISPARRSLSRDFPPAVHHGHTSSPSLPLHLPTHRNPLPNHGIRPRPRRRLPLRQRTETSIIIIIRQQAPPRRLQACPVRGLQIQSWERGPPCRSRVIRRQQATTIERSALENVQEGL